MDEIWKPIAGYEGTYEISNLGRVKRLKGFHCRADRILKPKKSKSGYLYVNLSQDNKAKPKTVHRIVAETFLPNPDNLPQVNHKDEDKANNCVSNLEWCTVSQNINYGTRNDRTKETLSKPVIQKTLSGEFVKLWPSTLEIQYQNKWHHGDILHCCNGGHFCKKRGKWVNNITAYGYKWEWAS